MQFLFDQLARRSRRYVGNFQGIYLLVHRYIATSLLTLLAIWILVIQRQYLKLQLLVLSPLFTIVSNLTDFASAHLLCFTFS